MQDDLILRSLIIRTKTGLPNKVTIQVLRVKTWVYLFGGPNSTHYRKYLHVPVADSKNFFAIS